MINKDFKSVIIGINIDLILKNITKSPSRCARNIIELGLASTIKDNLKLQKDLLYNNLLVLFDKGNISDIKEWFFKTFF